VKIFVKNTESRNNMQSFKTANLLDDLVVGERNSLLVKLSVTSLVDQLPDALQVRVPEQTISRHKLPAMYMKPLASQFQISNKEIEDKLNKQQLY
jgi:hypothetical protein